MTYACIVADTDESEAKLQSSIDCTESGLPRSAVPDDPDQLVGRVWDSAMTYTCIVAVTDKNETKLQSSVDCTENGSPRSAVPDDPDQLVGGA